MRPATMARVAHWSASSPRTPTSIHTETGGTTVLGLAYLVFLVALPVGGGLYVIYRRRTSAAPLIRRYVVNVHVTIAFLVYLALALVVVSLGWGHLLLLLPAGVARLFGCGWLCSVIAGVLTLPLALYLLAVGTVFVVRRDA